MSRRVRWLIPAALLGVLVTSCGDSDEQTESGNGAGGSSELCGAPVDPDVLSTFLSGDVELTETRRDGELILDCQADADDDFFWLTVDEITLNFGLRELAEGASEEEIRMEATEIADEDALVWEMSSMHYVECPEYGAEEGLLVYFGYDDEGSGDGASDAGGEFLLLAESVIEHVKDEYGCRAG